MAKQAAKSILGTFNLTQANKQQTVDKHTQRRTKLLAKLDEQILAAEALLKGEEYFGVKTVSKADEDGNRTSTTVQKRVRKWFYTNDGKEWYLEVKYGNRILQLAKDKTAIVVGALDNIVAVLTQVKEAVLANELDSAIEAALSKKK